VTHTKMFPQIIQKISIGPFSTRSLSKIGSVRPRSAELNIKVLYDRIGLSTLWCKLNAAASRKGAKGPR
jgi:hypothetical protein